MIAIGFAAFDVQAPHVAIGHAEFDALGQAKHVAIGFAEFDTITAKTIQVGGATGYRHNNVFRFTMPESYDDTEEEEIVLAILTEACAHVFF